MDRSRWIMVTLAMGASVYVGCGTFGLTKTVSDEEWQEDCLQPLVLDCDQQCGGVDSSDYDYWQLCIDGGYTYDLDCEAGCDCSAGSGSIGSGESDVRPWCSSETETAAMERAPASYASSKDGPIASGGATPSASGEVPADLPTAGEVRAVAGEMRTLLGRPLAEQHAYVDTELGPRLVSLSTSIESWHLGFARVYGHRFVDALGASPASRSRVLAVLDRARTGQIGLSTAVQQIHAITDPIMATSGAW